MQLVIEFLAAGRLALLVTRAITPLIACIDPLTGLTPDSAQ